MLFHITTRAAWTEAVTAGSYRPASLVAEGFIHLSTEAQWPRSLARFFAGQDDLVLLAIDPARVAAEIRYEEAHGESFPHLYGALDPAAVVDVRALASPSRD
jgi:uncharacterized protein (DUF952 family)